jgi:hypothetical protein
MKSELARVQADALELLHQALHTDQGEPSDITLLERVQSTGELVESKRVSRSWCYSEQEYLTGLRLPPGVDYELRVSELRLTADELKRGAAWKHGQRILKINGRPFAPSGANRFWRFYLNVSETASG